MLYGEHALILLKKIIFLLTTGLVAGKLTCTMELAKFIIPGSGVLVLWWALFHGHEANTDESFNNCVSSMQCKCGMEGGGGHTGLFRGKYTLII